MKKNEIIWHKNQVCPFHVAWVKNAKQFKQACKEYNTPYSPERFELGSNAAAFHGIELSNGGFVALINFDPNIEVSEHAKLALLAHEVMHVVQFVERQVYCMDSGRLDQESQAYLFQWIYVNLIADIFPNVKLK